MDLTAKNLHCKTIVATFGKEPPNLYTYTMIDFAHLYYMHTLGLSPISTPPSVCSQAGATNTGTRKYAPFEAIPAGGGIILRIRWLTDTQRCGVGIFPVLNRRPPRSALARHSVRTPCQTTE